MNKIIQSTYLLFLDLLFPKKCVICNCYGNWICSDCLKDIHLIKTDVCFYCGKISDRGKICNRCRRPDGLSGIISSIAYDSKAAKELVHNLKYMSIKDIAQLLGEFMVQRVRASKLILDGFVVVPVPSHKKRQSARGYNQAELLARYLCFRTGLSGGSVLDKIRETKPQVSFGRELRLKNIEGSIFCVDAEFILDKKVLLVDDISTTGATLSECAKILKQNGAKEVWALVVAHA